MPSGWEVYYVVFLSAVLALGIPAALAVVSRLVSARRPVKPAPSDAEEPRAMPEAPEARARSRRVNTRYFLAANAALVLIGLGLLLIPCSVVMSQEASRGEVLRGLIAILSVAGFAALGLLYSSRKGDLNWLRSYQEPKRGGRGNR